MPTIDIALAVERILPAAEYYGSTTANTPESWAAVDWRDQRRDKPSWEEIEAAGQAAAIHTIITEYKNRIQNRLDDFAQTEIYGDPMYDNILSACSYATSNTEMYHIEGQYCVDARDATWFKAYELLNAIVPMVMSGGEIPSWEEIEAQLPQLVWPEGSRGYKEEV